MVTEDEVYMLALGPSEIRRLVSFRDAVQAIEEAFAALSRGDARLPDVIGLEIPEARGEVHVKGAHIAGNESFVFKVASGFWSNEERGLPVGSGLMLAFDATTGFPQALLLDGGYLTELRTGAAGAVAVRHLAAGPPRRVGLVGAGSQARFQLRALAAVQDLDGVEVRIWSRRRERAEECAAELSGGVDADAVGTVREAVESADLVYTVTPSREPLVRAGWVAPGALVVAVGSDGPDKKELEVDLLARADRVFADRLDQCLRLGEIHHAVSCGALAVEDVAGELGDVVRGTVAGREGPDQTIVCDLTGVGVQDAAIATLALRRARQAGVGAEIEDG